jgi:hypothetical protein
MSVEIVERTIALLGALLVGATATVQLKNELPVRGLDASVAKVLLGLMIVGCLLAILAAVHVLGG